MPMAQRRKRHEGPYEEGAHPRSMMDHWALSLHRWPMGTSGIPQCPIPPLQAGHHPHPWLPSNGATHPWSTIHCQARWIGGGGITIAEQDGLGWTSTVRLQRAKDCIICCSCKCSPHLHAPAAPATSSIVALPSPPAAQPSQGRATGHLPALQTTCCTPEWAMLADRGPPLALFPHINWAKHLSERCHQYKGRLGRPARRVTRGAIAQHRMPLTWPWGGGAKKRERQNPFNPDLASLAGNGGR